MKKHFFHFDSSLVLIIVLPYSPIQVCLQLFQAEAPYFTAVIQMEEELEFLKPFGLE